MGRQDRVEGIGYKEVYVLRIGIIYVSDAINFYYLLLFITHMLVLDKLEDALVYRNLTVIRCIFVELLYVYQTLVVWISKGLSD